MYFSQFHSNSTPACLENFGAHPIWANTFPLLQCRHHTFNSSWGHQFCQHRVGNCFMVRDGLQSTRDSGELIAYPAAIHAVRVSVASTVAAFGSTLTHDENPPWLKPLWR